MSRTFAQHAELYDIAFSWDVEAEVDWLLDRIGRSSRMLLEPGCGSARMFPAFVRRGVAVTGIDRSETMLDRARRRMRAKGLPEPTLVCADMAAFDLGARFDGAYCPVGTLGYLATLDRIASHLECVARHLRPGARYLVQIDLNDLRDHRPAPPDQHSRWEVEGPSGRLRCSCFAVGWDPERRVERQSCRFEMLTGSDAGEVYEDTDDVLLLDWPAWHRLIEGSRFRQSAAFDGRKVALHTEATVGPDLEGMRLTWHQLELDRG